MDCAKSLDLLSDFRDGALDEAYGGLVSAHLAECLPCTGIFRDLNSIVIAASMLHKDYGISFPDEDALWRRMKLTKKALH